MEAFKKFDVNGDGTAEREEILAVVQEHCKVNRDQAMCVLHVSMTKKFYFQIHPTVPSKLLSILAYCGYLHRGFSWQQQKQFET